MSYDAETIAQLETGQLVLRDFLTVFGKNGGTPVEINFWAGEDNVAANVVSAQDGSTDARNYIGGGTLRDVPPIVDAIGLEARSIEFGLSQIQSDVQDMVRAYNVRVAKVEFQRGLYDPATWSLVSTPFPRFLGRVDGASVETPEVGGEGAIRLTAASSNIDLTKTSPALKSDETQRLRSDDRVRRYSDTAAQIEVFWGLAKGSAD